MKYYRVNNRIITPKVRLIDENDKHLGIVETEKALDMARSKELSLVEIGPKSNPPVAKIIDFGQFKYDLKKKEKQQKKQQKASGVKGIRLTLRIGKHDLSLRVENAKKFLQQNQKVKIEMTLRGRERAHMDLAKDLINKFINMLGKDIKVEQPVKRQGYRLIALISPIKQYEQKNENS